jgi:hypothetical protein
MLVAPATRDIADITVEQVVQGWQRLAPRVALCGVAASI